MTASICGAGDVLAGRPFQMFVRARRGQPAATGRIARMLDGVGLPVARQRGGHVDATAVGQPVIQGHAGNRCGRPQAPAKQALAKLPGAVQAQDFLGLPHADAGHPIRPRLSIRRLCMAGDQDVRAGLVRKQVAFLRDHGAQGGAVDRAGKGVAQDDGMLLVRERHGGAVCREIKGRPHHQHIQPFARGAGLLEPTMRRAGVVVDRGGGPLPDWRQNILDHLGSLFSPPGGDCAVPLLSNTSSGPSICTLAPALMWMSLLSR